MPHDAALGSQPGRGPEAGELLELLATDPDTIPNFEAFCRQTDYRLVGARDQHGVYRLLIEEAT